MDERMHSSKGFSKIELLLLLLVLLIAVFLAIPFLRPIVDSPSSHSQSIESSENLSDGLNQPAIEETNATSPLPAAPLPAVD